ncbi:hypothetical protein DM860_014999 [Cuscuta australis]|uniref:Uncharacterized protein n=1 Tax=Cuscuta australis TaxID=267555 RepID=A0A328DHI5_9ASTE|nr:hypothetical protein DM860_014999 [Cuscuta australis]
MPESSRAWGPESCGVAGLITANCNRQIGEEESYSCRLHRVASGGKSLEKLDFAENLEAMKSPVVLCNWQIKDSDR